MMLLLAPELLSIALCAGSVEGELGPIGNMDELITDELQGAARAVSAL